MALVRVFGSLLMMYPVDDNNKNTQRFREHNGPVADTMGVSSMSTR